MKQNSPLSLVKDLLCMGEKAPHWSWFVVVLVVQGRAALFFDCLCV